MEKLKTTFLTKNRNRSLCVGIIVLAYIIIEILMRTGSLKSLFINLLVPVTSYIIVQLK